MTRNEYIASIMLEAADLLREDNTAVSEESLNEGVGLKILAGMGAMYGSVILYFIIHSLLVEKVTKRKMKKMGSKYITISDYRCIEVLKTKVYNDITKIVNEAKHISYKKGVPEVIKQHITIVKTMSRQIENMVKTISAITTMKEFNDKENDFIDKFKKIYDKTIQQLNSVDSKISDEWIEDDSIKSLILELLSNRDKLYINDVDNDSGIWNNMKIADADDYSWEKACDFCYKIFEQADKTSLTYLSPTKYIKIKMVD